jgi:hypothetical protein
VFDSTSSEEGKVELWTENPQKYMKIRAWSTASARLFRNTIYFFGVARNPATSQPFPSRWMNGEQMIEFRLGRVPEGAGIAAVVGDRGDLGALAPANAPRRVR